MHKRIYKKISTQLTFNFILKMESEKAMPSGIFTKQLIKK